MTVPCPTCGWATGEVLEIPLDPGVVVVVCDPILRGQWLVLDDWEVRQIRLRRDEVIRVEIVHRWEDDPDPAILSFAVELGTRDGFAYRISEWGPMATARDLSSKVWTTLVSGVNS